MPCSLSADELTAIFPEINDIKNNRIRSGVIDIWIEVAAEMPWATIQEVPKNLRAEASRPLYQHIRGVTQMMMELCRIARDLHGKEFDEDLALASCLLHDASKPVETEPVPGAERYETGVLPGRKSHLGEMLQHGVYAAHKVLNKGLSMELANLIITHTHASNMKGKSWEAAALFYADFADTDVALSDSDSPMYVERWKL